MWRVKLTSVFHLKENIVISIVTSLEIHVRLQETDTASATVSMMEYEWKHASILRSLSFHVHPRTQRRRQGRSS